MRVSNSFSKYDSTIQANTNLNSEAPVTKVGKSRDFLEAFKVVLSPKALFSKELKDPSINYPTHNPDVLQYSQNLNLIFKP